MWWDVQTMVIAGQQSLTCPQPYGKRHAWRKWEAVMRSTKLPPHSCP